MLRIEDGGKSKRLSASHALLVSTVDSDTNISISAATRAGNDSLRSGHLDLARSSSDPVSSNHRLSFMRPATVKGLFRVFTFF
ncbi:hypothetical protein TNCV_4991311 [Trichonephila clavipes]|nr:hypothetical protein TNCV_4991311 [Trichonephila clavipes]